MSERDTNGFRVKPGHDGERHGHPTGPYQERYLWLVRRNDDKLYGYWDSRHDAVGAIASERRLRVPNKRDWLKLVRVTVGSVRPDDVIQLNESTRFAP